MNGGVKFIFKNVKNICAVIPLNWLVMEEENPKKRSRDQDDSLIIKKVKVNEYQGPQRVAKKTKVSISNVIHMFSF